MLAARIAAMAMGLSFKDLVLLWHDLSVVNLLIEIMYNDDSADFHMAFVPSCRYGGWMHERFYILRKLVLYTVSGNIFPEFILSAVMQYLSASFCCFQAY
ncbi:hypothetical protein L2E82_12485 [Cichorium intybus]|uniref:Uncharacterized protein n=1 Tax=Cichorium intybus TaxID=13427 RepID=A0ACB9GG29_CICIN|nr:hypothetical protein L2E82_12485 [Cichorium intybus]